MLAICLDETGPVLRRMPPPAPGPGEALVRVRLAGICATDLELIRGYMGFRGVLGHEFVGEVEALAAGSVRTAPMVGARLPLDQGLQALEKAGEKGILKAPVDPGATSSST